MDKRYAVKRTGRTFGVFEDGKLIEGGFFERDAANECRDELVADAAKTAARNSYGTQGGCERHNVVDCDRCKAPAVAAPVVDYYVRNEGTIVLFWTETPAAVAWWAEHVDDNGPLFAGAHVVEHRYAWDIHVGLRGAGLRAGDR